MLVILFILFHPDIVENLSQGYISSFNGLWMSSAEVQFVVVELGHYTGVHSEIVLIISCCTLLDPDTTYTVGWALNSR